MRTTLSFIALGACLSIVAAHPTDSGVQHVRLLGRRAAHRHPPAHVVPEGKVVKVIKVVHQGQPQPHGGDSHGEFEVSHQFSSSEDGDGHEGEDGDGHEGDEDSQLPPDHVAKYGKTVRPFDEEKTVEHETPTGDDSTIPLEGDHQSTDTDTDTDGSVTPGPDNGARDPSCGKLGPAPALSADLKTTGEWYINYHRCNHSSTATLDWLPLLADNAQRCGDQCKPPEDIHCLDDGSNAQIIAPKSESGSEAMREAIQTWYYGMYDPKHPSDDHWNTIFTNGNELTPAGKAGQMTHGLLMLKREHVKVGCAISKCSGSNPFVVVCDFQIAKDERGNPVKVPGPPVGVPLGGPSIDGGQGTGKGDVPLGTTLDGSGPE